MSANNIVSDQISPFTSFTLNISLKYYYKKENNIRLILYFLLAF